MKSREDRKTTWEGWAFLIAWAFIIAAGITYGISEATDNAHLGKVLEKWSIGLIIAGAGGLVGIKAFVK